MERVEILPQELLHHGQIRVVLEIVVQDQGALQLSLQIH